MSFLLQPEGADSQKQMQHGLIIIQLLSQKCRTLLRGILLLKAFSI